MLVGGHALARTGRISFLEAMGNQALVVLPFCETQFGHETTRLDKAAFERPQSESFLGHATTTIV